MKRSLPDLETLCLKEQVAQMVVVRASGYLFDHQIQYPQWEPPTAKLQYWLEHLGVGGVILLGGSAGEIALRSQQLQNWAKIPLLIAADIEEGVGQRFSGATAFPPPMAISAIANKNLSLAQHYATQMGAITAQEALAIGVNWVLAPVVDVNNNPDNPVINVRAFGETPEIVSKLATAFIQGAKAYPVLTTAKHFPGHGDTATDSHLDLPVLPHSAARLASVELPPFESAIAAGVDAVMSAHLLIPSWDAQQPATLSEPILTQQLRQKLGFEKLIVTDALVMGAIANHYGTNVAPVLAVEAGADILLMPIDPEGAIQAICEAVESGRISAERIRASVERIWQAKLKVSRGAEERGSRGAGEQRSGGVGEQEVRLRFELAQADTLATVDNILRETQLVYGSVPLQLEISATDSRPLCNLIVVDNLLACDFLGQHTEAIALPAQLGYTTNLIDLHTPISAIPAGNQLTLLQLFIRGNPFRGSAGTTQVAQDWFKKLLHSGNLQALVVYGSPYVLAQFLPLPPEVPCVFSYGQMPAAQAIALNTLLPT
ncbi:MAG: beta-glucosidase [Gloeocapsa sp. UFS-A4-WI-NPMV-4B04]|jgi:beta-glucosidase|nr:beta-glucosidase [Gloeocapsa sp. UFS-A4-WI-NPMV-4B04]